jgi:hypothetical protein
MLGVAEAICATSERNLKEMAATSDGIREFVEASILSDRLMVVRTPFCLAGTQFHGQVTRRSVHATGTPPEIAVWRNLALHTMFMCVHLREAWYYMHATSNCACACECALSCMYVG